MSHLTEVKEIGKILSKSRRTHLLPGEIHGLLSGILCGPEVISPTLWLGCIFSGSRDLKTIVSKPWFGALVEHLIAAYEDLLFALRAGTFVPYLTESESDSEKLHAARLWCCGFLYGMHLHGEQWRNCDDDQLASLCAPLFYFADPETVTIEIDEIDRKKLADKALEMIAVLRYNVPKVFDFWNFGRKPELKKEYFSPQ